MRPLLQTLALSTAVATCAVACGGAQTVGNQAAFSALDEQCYAVRRQFGKDSDSGKHIPISVLQRGAKGMRTAVSEAELASRLAQARSGGETWVLARAGAGKSHLAWTLRALTCDKVPAIHIAIGTELRPLLATGTRDRPALARAMLDALGDKSVGDPGQTLAAYFGGQPWLLILDGADELNNSERRKLATNIVWLRQAGLGQHLVRLERPGFETVDRTVTPDAAYEVPELTCSQAETAMAKQLGPDPKVQTAAKAWISAHQLDHKRPGTICRYTHMATWRDAEVVAGLARAAAEGDDEDIPTDPSRAELYGYWLGLKLRPFTPRTSSALEWLDRIVSAGISSATEPDLQFTPDRCMGVSTPGGQPAEQACLNLISSSVFKPSVLKGSYVLNNQTLADLLMARWLVAHNSECGPLGGATAALGSLEVTAMVAATGQGRACMPQLVGSVCSLGTAPEDLSSFIQEAVPKDARNNSLIDRWASQASSDCERQVYASLLK